MRAMTLEEIRTTLKQELNERHYWFEVDAGWEGCTPLPEGFDSYRNDKRIEELEKQIDLLNSQLGIEPSMITFNTK